MGGAAARPGERTAGGEGGAENAAPDQLACTRSDALLLIVSISES